MKSASAKASISCLFYYLLMIMLIKALNNCAGNCGDFCSAAAMIFDAYPSNLGLLTAAPPTKTIRSNLDDRGSTRP